MSSVISDDSRECSPKVQKPMVLKAGILSIRTEVSKIPSRYCCYAAVCSKGFLLPAALAILCTKIVQEEFVQCKSRRLDNLVCASSQVAKYGKPAIISHAQVAWLDPASTLQGRTNRDEWLRHRQRPKGSVPAGWLQMRLCTTHPTSGNDSS